MIGRSTQAVGVNPGASMEADGGKVPAAPEAVNVALGKRAIQSSITIFRSSKPGGAGATSGIKTGGLGFQTKFEWFPWWLLDLERRVSINRVVVFNREDAEADRARTLTVSLADDPAGPWVEVHRCDRAFGGIGRGDPLTLALSPPIEARYVRLHLNERTSLHLDEVEVYGSPVGPLPTAATGAAAPATDDFPAIGGGVRSWAEIWRERQMLELWGQKNKVDVDQILVRPMIFTQPQRAFNGSVEVLRIEPGGLWGNVFYAFLNGAMIARTLGCKAIELHGTHFIAPKLPIQIDGIDISMAGKEAVNGHTLSLSCYWPNGLETSMGQYKTDFAIDTIERFIKPIFSQYLKESGSLGEQTIVLHFRGGEIFAPGGTNNWYVQPPVSYYTRAVEFAIMNLAISHVHVVYQDKSNPAVDAVIEYLKRRMISFSTQSATTKRDIATILSAHHIVAAYGTFCEAISLLSSQVKSYFAFRSIKSQQKLSFWTQDRFDKILRAKRVRTFVIDDPDDSYTAKETWKNSPEQNEAIKSYPVEKLRLIEYFE